MLTRVFSSIVVADMLEHLIVVIVQWHFQRCVYTEMRYLQIKWSYGIVMVDYLLSFFGEQFSYVFTLDIVGGCVTSMQVESTHVLCKEFQKNSIIQHFFE